MRFTQLDIDGVWAIDIDPVKDSRGTFFRSFCQKEFEAHGLNPQVAQANISQNNARHTLRGFHYQIKPFEECKTFFCVTGSIYDIVVDLRPGSKTFLKWISLELNDQNNRMLHIPGGCANAYLTMDDNTIIHYYMSEFYHSDSYRGFRYNDPFFNVTWPVRPAIVSDKDVGFADFNPNKM